MIYSPQNEGAVDACNQRAETWCKTNKKILYGEIPGNKRYAI
jgi:hypothetical protein